MLKKKKSKKERKPESRKEKQQEGVREGGNPVLAPPSGSWGFTAELQVHSAKHERQDKKLLSG